MGDDNLRVFMVASEAHHQALVDGLWNFYRHKLGTDFDFEWKGQSIQAHKLVVDIFLSPKVIPKSEKTSTSENQELDLTTDSIHNDDFLGQNRTSSTNLNLLMEFLYNGKVSVKREHLDDFLTLARELNFKLLVDAITGSIRSCLDPTKDSPAVKRKVNPSCAVNRPPKNARMGRKRRLSNVVANLQASINPKASRITIRHQAKTSSVNVPGCSTAAGDRNNHNAEENITSDDELECGGSIAETRPDESPIPITDDEIDLDDGSEYRGPKTTEEPPIGSRQLRSREIPSGHTAASEESGEVDRTGEEYESGSAVQSNTRARRTPTQNSYRKKKYCPHCPYTSTDLHKFRLHVTRHTDPSLLFRCDICPRMYLRQTGLDKHLANHRRQETADEPPVTYHCPICERSSTKTNWLTHHLKNVHEVEADGRPVFKPFACDTCDKRFLERYKLKLHVAIEHTNERRFRCEKCPYASNRKADLGIHVRLVHEKDASKQLLCETCGFKSSTVSNMRKHGLTHLGMKPFACEICGNRYAQLEGLRNHAVTHVEGYTVEALRPHACHVCGLRFMVRSKLARHLKRSHQEEVVPTRPRGHRAE